MSSCSTSTARPSPQTWPAFPPVPSACILLPLPLPSASPPRPPSMSKFSSTNLRSCWAWTWTVRGAVSARSRGGFGWSTRPEQGRVRTILSRGGSSQREKPVLRMRPSPLSSKGGSPSEKKPGFITFDQSSLQLLSSTKGIPPPTTLKDARRRRLRRASAGRRHRGAYPRRPRSHRGGAPGGQDGLPGGSCPRRKQGERAQQERQGQPPAPKEGVSPFPPHERPTRTNKPSCSERGSGGPQPPVSRSPPRPPRRKLTSPQTPTPSNVLGVFGLSIRTRERDLEEEFGRHGRVEKVVIVYDQRVRLPAPSSPVGTAR